MTEPIPQSDTSETEKKSFGRDVGKLVSGTMVAQVVAICLTPIITRIFNPEIYGVASVFTSIVSIIVVIACMRYELAILLPKDDKDAGAVFLLCLIILVCVSLVCVPVMFLCGDWIAGLLGNSAVAEYLFLVPVAVFIDGLYLALRYWNTRRKRFGTQAVTQALQSVSANSLRFGFGTAGWVVPGALIGGQVIGQGIGTVILARQMLKNDLTLILGSFSPGNIKQQMVRYKKFPLIDTWSAFINTVSWQMPVLMLTGFFSSTVAGLYTLGFQMIQLPMSFIGSSISQVFFQRSAAAKDDGTLNRLVESVSEILLVVSICPAVLLLASGGTLFSFVFGSEWQGAGVFCQILAIWAIAWFISSPLSTLTSVLEIQGFGLKITTLNLVTRIISLAIGGIVGNVLLALVLFALSGIAVYGIQLLYLYKKISVSTTAVIYRIWKWVLLSILMSFGVFTAVFFNVPDMCIFVLVCICAAVYYGLLFLKNKEVKSYLR